MYDCPTSSGNHVASGRRSADRDAPVWCGLSGQLGKLREVFVIPVNKPELCVHLAEDFTDGSEISLSLDTRPDPEVPEMQYKPALLTRQQLRNTPDHTERPFTITVPVPSDQDTSRGRITTVICPAPTCHTDI